MLTLEAWMRAKGLKDGDVGEELGCPRSTICRFRKGLRIPNRDFMRAIFRLSGGLVTPNDFYGLHSAPGHDGRAAPQEGRPAAGEPSARAEAAAS